MNKVIKKIFIFTSLALVFVGCTKDYNLTTTTPYSNTYTYTIDSSLNFNKMTIKIYRLNNYEWEEVSNNTYDKEGNNLTITLDEFKGSSRTDASYYVNENNILETYTFFPSSDTTSEESGHQITAISKYKLKNNEEKAILLYICDKEDKDFEGGIKLFDLNNEYYAKDGFVVTITVE